METPTTRLRLLEARRELLASIKASEQWHPSYRANGKQFNALVEAEGQLETDVGEYLHALSFRAHQYVDWTQYQRELDAQPKVTASIRADGVSGAGSEVWDAEALDLTRYIIDAITLISTIGVDAALERYGFPLLVDSVQDFVALAAQKHVAGLVSDVTETTRNKIRLSIKQSLTRGETTPQAIERLQKIINNPVRAEMIAQTESVNAYALGQYNYAVETGAKKKIWESLAGACEHKCGPIDGQKRSLDKKFKLADGTEVDLPAGHPRCRCGVYYEY